VSSWKSTKAEDNGQQQEYVMFLNNVGRQTIGFNLLAPEFHI